MNRLPSRAALCALAGTTAAALASGALLVGFAPVDVSTGPLDRDRFETVHDTTPAGGERLKDTELDDVANTSAPPPSIHQEI
jgi:hypothetical protein